MELIVRKNTMARVAEIASQAKETKNTLDALTAFENKTAQTLVHAIRDKYLHEMGYVMGGLKANLDTMPEEIASTLVINSIPLNLMIKMKVDEFVLDQREKHKITWLSCDSDYSRQYRYLSEMICGYGYNMYFINERFEAYFPAGIHHFVEGFANGYSETFHEIAEKCGINTEHTNPKEQDIWRNWQYFICRDCVEYRIDGKYLFMYHGGWCPEDPTIPYRNNEKIVNENVYELIRAHDFLPKNYNIEL